jgi:fucose permease
MLAQLPSKMLITRVRPAIYLPLCALLWSGVSAATAAISSAGKLFVVQFVLGIIEAPLFPGVSLPSCRGLLVSKSGCVSPRNNN